eukprot:gnl/MRDRNA2_/MRDRNA2_49513_c0_seq1.p1 gnl/MRDRNA2_/MRDRNA2_49513_c0~~gnl/MRDRNA2_/MRDRNA2_49513_c0_seq1.p1  ORF type:complete len:293 (+),score=48.10 gnl/MRDRNA2_/MRDRNA2_49513_c0_seq1:35-880(+)
MPKSFGEAARMPCVYINHGGGPMPLLGQQPDVQGFLSSYLATLPQQPRAVLVVTAHWESAGVTVSSAKKPPLLFDYGGFPPETYQYKYPAAGSPDVAVRVQHLLKEAGIPCAADEKRGWDHGVFVPMMCMCPAADIPICMLSVLSNQDASSHLAMGRALEPLRSEGVLIVGSGVSFHNMGCFFGRDRIEGMKASKVWDGWLRKILTDNAVSSDDRKKMLASWTDAPSARMCHPPNAAEHLMPLFVVCGAAACSIGRSVGDEYKKQANEMLEGFAISQFEFP